MKVGTTPGFSTENPEIISGFLARAPGVVPTFDFLAQNPPFIRVFSTCYPFVVTINSLKAQNTEIVYGFTADNTIVATTLNRKGENPEIVCGFPSRPLKVEDEEFSCDSCDIGTPIYNPSYIKHLLDFWHLIKSINHDLREFAKKKSCPNIKYWQSQIINHGYYVHSKYGKSRERGLKYWKSVLAHVTGRHNHFAKVPFLHGIKRCKHKALQTSSAHQIKRGSEEYHALKAIVMKRTFMAGFLRASPKKNTSPNECFNSIINLYAPKIRACSHKWYEERIKLATLHFNTLALLNMLDMRVEKGNCSVKVNGRQGDTVKRKMASAKHEWRKEAWEEIPKVIERMRLQQFLKKNNAPSDRGYILALQQEEGDEGDEEGQAEDGAESDVSVELGGGLYEEAVDSDQEPLMNAIELSDVEDRESEEEEDEEDDASSGSEWDEGEAGRIVLEKGGRGRGRGRGGRGRGRAQSVVTADRSAVLPRTPSDQEEVQGCIEEGKGEQRKKGIRSKGGRKTVKDDSSSDSDSEKPPLKKGRRKGVEGNRGE